MSNRQWSSWWQLLVFIPGMVCLSGLASAQSSAKPSSTDHGVHFDRVLIIVLENQNFESAMRDKFLSDLAEKGVSFSNFKGVAHPSLPNYLAMIAGSTFGVRSDSHKDFPDDDKHRTIANLMDDWRNYAEDYPAKRDATGPFLGDRKGNYVRKHVPFLSFTRVQKHTFQNVVSVDTHDTNNAFVSDISAFKRDAAKNLLPRYMFYTPNLDDDGHDPVLRPRKGLQKASEWLQKFLDTWLKLDDKLKGTLVVITFDESEGNEASNRIYTVFLGDMLKPGNVDKEYSHYSVLCTIEENFRFTSPLNPGNPADCAVKDIWK